MSRRYLLLLGIASFRAPSSALSMSGISPPSAVHSIIVSTSVADWTPALDPICACLESITACDALTNVPIWVVADCIPSSSEVATLSELDASKWSELWSSKRKEYEDYLDHLEKHVASTFRDRDVTLVRLEEFGHLVGTVRRGFEECGADDDDVVLIFQHDLALASPVSISKQVVGLLAALQNKTCPVEYVLLNRDCNDSPRSVGWLNPQHVFHFELESFLSTPKALPENAEMGKDPMTAGVAGEASPGGDQGGSEEATTSDSASRSLSTGKRAFESAAAHVLELSSTGGRFSDQAHFTRAGWYREAVLGACGDRRTCMEHALHENHGGGTAGSGDGRGALGGSTFVLGGPHSLPAVHDLVHGSMVPTSRLSERQFLGFPAHFERLREESPDNSEEPWRPHPWSVVMWDPTSGGARGALNYAHGDASRPADAIALPPGR